MTDTQKRFPLLILSAVLFFLIICPLVTIFVRAVITDGRLDFGSAWQTLTESKNAEMILNSLLLGAAGTVLSTIIAAPLAYLFTRTSFAKYRFFDIIFMIPFMTPPYIASMGWILFMQKRGLLQQLLPFTAGCEKIFFTFGGLALVMSLHVFPLMLTILKNAMLNIRAPPNTLVVSTFIVREFEQGSVSNRNGNGCALRSFHNNGASHS